MGTLLLLILLILPATQGNSCDAQIQELRQQLKRVQAEMEAKMEKQGGQIKAEIESKEAKIRQEVAEVAATVPSVVSRSLRDLPYFMACSYQDSWTSVGTITYDYFITDFNNADRHILSNHFYCEQFITLQQKREYLAKEMFLPKNYSLDLWIF